MTVDTRLPDTVGDALARRAQTRQGVPFARAGVMGALGAVDRAVYDAVARTPTATLDGPVRLLAAGVAYSRVDTGVHYPGDVVAGSLTGAGTAAMVAAIFDRLATRRATACRPGRPREA